VTSSRPCTTTVTPTVTSSTGLTPKPAAAAPMSAKPSGLIIIEPNQS
jgi:hypothetical protein